MEPSSRAPVCVLVLTAPFPNVGSAKVRTITQRSIATVRDQLSGASPRARRQRPTLHDGIVTPREKRMSDPN
jgi:hypothetical protein